MMQMFKRMKAVKMNGNVLDETVPKGKHEGDEHFYNISNFLFKIKEGKGVKKFP